MRGDRDFTFYATEGMIASVSYMYEREAEATQAASSDCEMRQHRQSLSLALTEDDPELGAGPRKGLAYSSTYHNNNNINEEEEEKEETNDEQHSSPQAAVTPLPKMRLLLVLVCFLAECLSMNILYPFIGDMVEDFHLSDDDTKVGLYVGLLSSSFIFCQFFSSYPLGLLSDRIGRRPVLLTGLIGNALFSALFGASKSYGMAMLWRCLNGLANGNFSVIRVYIREITDETNQAVAFSYMGLTWGLSSVLSPLIGGPLAKPANRWNVASVFEDYPYLLPCLVASIFSMLGTILSYFYLEESFQPLPATATTVASTDADSMSTHLLASSSHNSNESIALEQNGARSNSLVPSVSSPGLGGGRKSLSRAERIRMSDKYKTVATVYGTSSIQNADASSSSSAATAAAGEGVAMFTAHAGPYGQQRENETNKADTSTPSSTSSVISLTSSTSSGNNNSSAAAVAAEDTSSSVQQQQQQQLQPDNPGILTLLRVPNVALLSILFSLVRFSATLASDVFAAWAPMARSRGGMNLTNTQISYCFLAQGIASVLFQLILFVPMMKRWGLIRMFQIAMVAAALCTITPGLLRGIQGVDSGPNQDLTTDFSPMFWVIMIVSFFIRGLTIAGSFTSISILMNNGVSTHVGAAQGLIAAFASLAQGAGPFIGGATLSLSLQYPDNPFPVDYNITFVYAAILSMFAAALAAKLPRDIMSRSG